MTERPLQIYFVLGEESGDALGADLVPALQAKAAEKGQTVDIVGLGGNRLNSMGIKSLFDIEEIAVMGFSAVIGRLPLIVRRVYQTVSDIVARKPDLVVLIDSPDFTHAVAKRVRKKCPDLPIINYVCPSVWAWRSSRARAMTAYIDHVLAILPFEPDALKELSGPSTTYIGHPVARKVAAIPAPEPKEAADVPVLLVLPGSRRSEIKRMLPRYGRTLEILRARGTEFRAVLPAVGHLRGLIEEEISTWEHRPEIVESDDNDRTFPSATAALATSGTVTLELALHKVPMVTAYRLDPLVRVFGRLITIWSSILPNLIADRILVPEEHNETVIPDRLARRLERLLDDTPERRTQLDGFDEVIKRMKTNRPPSELAADVILDHIV